MILFQIEEPDGSPLSAEGPGAAIGIDLTDAEARVAIAVGGNAELLRAGDGEPGPATAPLRDAKGLFLATPTSAALLALRGIAERALARPVTHAVVAVAAPLDDAVRASLADAAAASDVAILRVLDRSEALALGGNAPQGAALGAAIAAEELAPPAGA